MKQICFLILVIIFAIGISAAEVPELLGKWTGSFSACNEGNARLYWTHGSIIFNVAEQKDRIFAGNLTIRPDNEKEIIEGFVGAIGSDNKTFYRAEFDKGYSIGTIISKDEIEYVYITDGKNASVSIDKLHRLTNVTNTTNPFA